MPIDRNDFKELPTEALGVSPDTNAYRVLRFLASDPGKAYTRSEIRDATGVSDGSVGPVLSRLDDRDLVEHRGNYWAVDEDDERLQGLATE